MLRIAKACCVGFKDRIHGFYFFFEAVRNAPQDSELFYSKKLVEFHVNWTAYNLRSQFFPSIGTFRHFYQGCKVFFLREVPLKSSQIASIQIINEGALLCDNVVPNDLSLFSK